MIHRWSHERFGEGPESSITELLDWDGERIVFAVEDQGQEEKVHGQTRIAEGLYELDVRPDSPKFAHYYEDAWSRDWFRGMPWFRDIEGDGEGFEAMQFTWVYYHPGKDHTHSHGCPIVGLEYSQTETGDFEIVGGTSRPAFRKLCELVYQVVLDGSETDRILVRVTDWRLPKRELVE